jgi:hypothetical protein
MGKEKQEPKPEQPEKGLEKEQAELSVERPDDRRVSINSTQEK